LYPFLCESQHQNPTGFGDIASHTSNQKIGEQCGDVKMDMFDFLQSCLSCVTVPMTVPAMAMVMVPAMAMVMVPVIVDDIDELVDDELFLPIDELFCHLTIANILHSYNKKVGAFIHPIDKM